MSEKVGIIGYGAYVPRYRIRVAEIARAWGWDAEAFRTGLAMEEKAVAAQRGIVLGESIVESSLKKAENFPFETKSSYQRDVEGRRRNEGDLFGGTILRLGTELGVPTPVTERLYREIEEKVGGAGQQGSPV